MQQLTIPQKIIWKEKISLTESDFSRLNWLESLKTTPIEFTEYSQEVRDDLKIENCLSS